MSELVNVYLLSSAVTLLVIAIVLFVAYYNKKQSEQKLALKAIEFELQQKLLLNSLEVQEAASRRIARDLHDEVGALLSATKMSFNVLNKRLRDAEDRSSLLNSKKLLDESIATVRRISKELIPTSLENFGLLAAVEDFLNKIKTATGLAINLESNLNEETRFEPNQELMVYRILQELTNNAIKHAGASELEIKLTHYPNQLSLVFFDNGKGFDPNNLVQNGDSGLGLRNIESRVSVINGKCTISSTPESGSRFDIFIPI